MDVELFVCKIDAADVCRIGAEGSCRIGAEDSCRGGDNHLVEEELHIRDSA
jgi:hypothetical protein